MCTLIVLHRCVPGIPLAVGANRDEFFDRPAEGPALRRMGCGDIVAPQDGRAGGTWLGLNAHGVFSAVTNRPCQTPDPERRSRGGLVLEALRYPTAAEAKAKLEDSEALAVGAYNPFNLLVADADHAFAVTYEESPRYVELGAGPIVIGNADPTAPPTPKLTALYAQARALAGATAATVLDELAAICRSHAGNDELQNACVHAGGYGTRSSTLIRIGNTPSDNTFRHAGGAPCSTEYEDFTPLLHELSVSGSLEKDQPIARKVS